MPAARIGIALTSIGGLMLVLAACASPPATARLAANGRTITILGVVHEERSGRPLPGVMIQVLDTERRTQTGRDGHYRIEGVPAPNSRLSLRAELVGYIPESREIWAPVAGDVVCPSICLVAWTDTLDFHLRQVRIGP
jgi:hypothetical protein